MTIRLAMLTRAALLLLATTGLSACVGASLPTSEERLDSFRSHHLDRAAFELDCPADRLDVIDLQPQMRGWLRAQFGVRGCDRRAVYVVTSNGVINNTGWETKNSAPGNSDDSDVDAVDAAVDNADTEETSSSNRGTTIQTAK